MICYPRAMRALLLPALLAGALARPAAAQEEYGARGLFPVYDYAGQWTIYDKTAQKGGAQALKPGNRFLVVGSEGAELFTVARASAAWGGACRARQPVRLRAALLKGRGSAVGDPVLAVKVPARFSLKGSNARYRSLPNAVSEELYRSLGPGLSAAALEEARSGEFKFKPDDNGAAGFMADPKPEAVLLKIDYATPARVAGLKEPIALVTGTQISNSCRRCLRLADEGRLLGGCVEMPHDLMGETALLRFVSYDPSGKGAPLLLAYTKEPAPLWGHERWIFLLRPTGPKLLLRDAMDPRCREGF